MPSGLWQSFPSTQSDSRRCPTAGYPRAASIQHRRSSLVHGLQAVDEHGFRSQLASFAAASISGCWTRNNRPRIFCRTRWTRPSAAR
jgi:hypothetical protein